MPHLPVDGIVCGTCTADILVKSGGTLAAIAPALPHLDLYVPSLDEATSSLDPATEAQIMALLADRARAGTTVVAVTHHLDNVDEADKLLTLGHGEVAVRDSDRVNPARSRPPIPPQLPETREWPRHRYLRRLAFSGRPC